MSIRNLRGFSLLGIVVVVAILTVLGFGGYVSLNQQPSFEIGEIHNDVQITANTEAGAHISRREGFLDPVNDKLVVVSDNELQVNLAGWSVRSAVSGKSFTIETVTDSTGVTRPVTLNGSDTAVFIKTAGVKEAKSAEAETHINFGGTSVAWGVHDTIELVNEQGKVVDSYTYPIGLLEEKNIIQRGADNILTLKVGETAVNSGGLPTFTLVSLTSTEAYVRITARDQEGQHAEERIVSKGGTTAFNNFWPIGYSVQLLTLGSNSATFSINLQSTD